MPYKPETRPALEEKLLALNPDLTLLEPEDPEFPRFLSEVTALDPKLANEIDKAVLDEQAEEARELFGKGAQQGNVLTVLKRGEDRVKGTSIRGEKRRRPVTLAAYGGIGLLLLVGVTALMPEKKTTKTETTATTKVDPKNEAATPASEKPAETPLPTSTQDGADTAETPEIPPAPTASSEPAPPPVTVDNSTAEAPPEPSYTPDPAPSYTPPATPAPEPVTAYTPPTPEPVAPAPVRAEPEPVVPVRPAPRVSSAPKPVVLSQPAAPKAVTAQPVKPAAPRTVNLPPPHPVRVPNAAPPVAPAPSSAFVASAPPSQGAPAQSASAPPKRGLVEGVPSTATASAPRRGVVAGSATSGAQGADVAQGGGSAERPAGGGAAARALVSSAPEAAGRPPAAGLVAASAQGASAPAAQGLAMSSGQGQAGGARAGLVSSAAGTAAGGGVVTQGGAASGAAANAGVVTQGGAASGTGAFTGAAGAGGENAPGGAGAVVSAANPVPYSAGMRVQMRLDHGVAAYPGSAHPVWAVASDGSIWRGQATLDAAATRLLLAFDSVMVQGKSYPISAYAESKDGIGIGGHVQPSTPNAAQATVNGLLSGIKTFAESQAARTTTYTSSGLITQSERPQNFWLAVGGSLASAFSVPQTQAAVVPLGRMQEGEAFTVRVDLTKGETP